jgi:formylmethanofuran dehydrogenase subunit E
VVARPGGAGPPDPEWQELREKWGKETLTTDEQERFKVLHEARCRQILATPLEQLFEVKEPEMKLPRPARIMDSVSCDACGELTMETRTRRFRGKTLCIPCFQKQEQR